MLVALLLVLMLLTPGAAPDTSSDSTPTTATTTPRFSGDVTINPRPDPEPVDESVGVPLGLLAVGGGVVTLLVIIGAIRLSGDH